MKLNKNLFYNTIYDLIGLTNILILLMKMENLLNLILI